MRRISEEMGAKESDSADLNVESQSSSDDKDGLYQECLARTRMQARSDASVHGASITDLALAS